MIVKLEDVTLEQLEGLYQFLVSGDNRPRDHRDVPFTRIIKCHETPSGSTPNGTVDFNLTLEVQEWDGETVESRKHLPLRLIAQLLQALGRFPDEPAARRRGPSS